MTIEIKQEDLFEAFEELNQLRGIINALIHDYKEVGIVSKNYNVIENFPNFHKILYEVNFEMKKIQKKHE